MLFFFFFKQKTAYEMRISDWSSDVCSSDLSVVIPAQAGNRASSSRLCVRFLGTHAKARRTDLFRASSLKSDPSSRSCRDTHRYDARPMGVSTSLDTNG